MAASPSLTLQQHQNRTELAWSAWRVAGMTVSADLDAARTLLLHYVDEWMTAVQASRQPAARPVGCNRHVNCDLKRPGDPCCWDENCEDCFGR